MTSSHQTAGPAATPEPPYFAVIFSTVRTQDDGRAYDVTAARMLELAAQQPGYLGVEWVREQSGLGITVSYWQSRAAIAAWKAQAEHLLAQARGREDWYQRFCLRIAEVQDERTFELP